MDLRCAVISDDKGAAEKILSEGKHTDAIREFVTAIANGNIEMVKLFIKYEVKINTDGYEWAATMGHITIMKLLIEYDGNAFRRSSAFHYALLRNHVGIMGLLIDQGYQRTHLDYEKLQKTAAWYKLCKKYWPRWRRFMVRQWARRLLQMWFRPDMPGGLVAKKQLLSVQHEI